MKVKSSSSSSWSVGSEASPFQLPRALLVVVGKAADEAPVIVLLSPYAPIPPQTTSY